MRLTNMMTEREATEYVWPSIALRLPDWVGEETGPPGCCFPTVEDRMDLAIRLAERSVAEDVGAPFGACVFEIGSGALIAPGVSLVMRGNCSPAHGETLAIMGAQQAMGTFDLAASDHPPLELVTSAQPCVQCFGNIWWSGLKRVVMAATADDVERLTGFREGPLPMEWESRLADRAPLPAIEVVHHVLRERSCAVLRRYREMGGFIYNAGSGDAVVPLDECRATNLDAAAMHPEIGQRWKAPGKAYFRRVAALRERILMELSRVIGTRYELFLSGNTSAGLIAVCLAASRAGMAPPGLVNRPYPPYEALLGYPDLLKADQPMSICTHICPLTGEVLDLRNCGDSILVVDAAQSLGTLFQQEFVETAAIFVGPLHKHLNLVPGLGVVGVDFDAVDSNLGAALRTVLEVMQHGAVNLGVLERCVQRLNDWHGPSPINETRIHIGEHLRTVASGLGLRLLTPPGTQAHIASFTSIDGCPVGKLLDDARIGARIFERENIFRISLHSDVHGVRSPEEYEIFVADALSRAARKR